MEEHFKSLTQLFLKFPGIGERQAKRFASFILTQPSSYVHTLAQTLTRARDSAKICNRCLKIFEGNYSICSICSKPTRDESSLLVVEKSTDIDIFLQTQYNGLFFVLGNLIPVVQKKVVQMTNIELLKTRVEKEVTEGTLREVILALPITPNGEHTDEILRKTLAPFKEHGVSITSLGRGLSFGTEIEYADKYSLDASLKKRE